jgi:hypothetical protein
MRTATLATGTTPKVLRCLGRLLGGLAGAFVELHGGVNSALEYMVSHYAELATSNSPVASSVWMLEFDLAKYFGIGTTKLASVSVEVLVKQGQQTHIYQEDEEFIQSGKVKPCFPQCYELKNELSSYNT